MTPAVLAPLFLAAAVSAAVLALWWLDRYRREPVVPFLAAFAAGAAVAGTASAWRGLVVLPRLLRAWSFQGETGGLGATLAPHLAPALVLALLAAAAVLVLCPPARLPGLVEPVGIALAPVLGAAGVAGTAAAAAGAVRPAGAVLHVLFGALAGGVVGLLIGWVRCDAARPWRAVGLAAAPVAGAATMVGGAAVVADARVASFLAVGHRMAAAVLVPAVLLVGLFALALWLEGRIVRAELAKEVPIGVLPAWVVDAAASFRQRAFGDWWRPREERRVIGELLTRLAFRRRAMARAGGSAARVRGLEVGRLRQRARELLALHGEGGAAPAAGE